MTWLARGTEKHRSLLIATTDLDLGLGRYWDLGLETKARSAAAARERVHDILLASTAMPPVLPAVQIDDRWYVDGGIASSVFLGFDVAGMQWIAERWRERHPGLPLPTLRAWVIISRKLIIDERTVQTRFIDVARRSIEIMMEYDRLKALYAFVYMFNALNDLEGVRAELRYVAAPDEANLPEELTDLRNPEVNRRIVELGQAMGRNPANWLDGPPEIFFMPVHRASLLGR